MTECMIVVDSTKAIVQPSHDEKHAIYRRDGHVIRFVQEQHNCLIFFYSDRSLIVTTFPRHIC